MKKYDDYNKVKRIIESCLTEEHLEVARNVLDNFKKLHQGRWIDRFHRYEGNDIVDPLIKLIMAKGKELRVAALVESRVEGRVKLTVDEEASW